MVLAEEAVALLGEDKLTLLVNGFDACELILLVSNPVLFFALVRGLQLSNLVFEGLDKAVLILMLDEGSLEDFVFALEALAFLLEPPDFLEIVCDFGVVRAFVHVFH